MGKLQALGLVNQEEDRHSEELEEAKRAGRRSMIRQLRNAKEEREESNDVSDTELDEFDAGLVDPAETDTTEVDALDNGEELDVNADTVATDDGTDLETDVDSDDATDDETLNDGDTAEDTETGSAEASDLNVGDEADPALENHESDEEA